MYRKTERFLRYKTNQSYLVSPFLFNIIMEILMRPMKQETKKRVTPSEGKQKVKLSLQMTKTLQNDKYSTR